MTPTVAQKTPDPPGNIPKGRQTYIMLAVALVIVLAIVFTGPSSTTKAASALPAFTVNAPSKKEIDGFQEQLRTAEATARDAEVRAQRTRESLQQGQYAAAGLTGGIPGQSQYGQVYAQPQPAPPPVPQKDPIVAEREAREYKSLFAPNVALSFRGGSSPAEPPPAKPEPVVASAPAAAKVAPIESGFPLYEGTIIETVLTNRLEGSFTGPVNCQVTTPVYSHDHRHLLIPAGSRVLGEARRVDAADQQRLAVLFHRILLADESSINLDRVQGLDQAGATGLHDKVNNHYAAMLGTSVAMGLISGFSAFGTGSALSSGGFDVYRQGVANQVSQNSSRIMERQLNRMPTITIREGQRIKVYLTADLRVPEYSRSEQ